MNNSRPLFTIIFKPIFTFVNNLYQKRFIEFHLNKNTNGSFSPERNNEFKFQEVFHALEPVYIENLLTVP